MHACAGTCKYMQVLQTMLLSYCFVLPGLHFLLVTWLLASCHAVRRAWRAHCRACPQTAAQHWMWCHGSFMQVCAAS